MARTDELNKGNAEQVPAQRRSCFDESALLNNESFCIAYHAFLRFIQGFSPVFYYTGRTSPVSGNPHLSILISASMAKARLAFLSNPR